MTLLATEANVEIRNLLIDNWDSNSISLSQNFNKAWIHTGWYDESNNNPQISLTGVSEDTSPDGIVPNGTGLSSWVDGSIDCNIWVPYPDDTYSYNSQGEAKQFRHELKRKVHSIIENNQSGTTDNSNTPVLTRIETGDIQNDPTNEPPPFRSLVPINYQYYSSP